MSQDMFTALLKAGDRLPPLALHNHSHLRGAISIFQGTISVNRYKCGEFMLPGLITGCNLEDVCSVHYWWPRFFRFFMWDHHHCSSAARSCVSFPIFVNATLWRSTWMRQKQDMVKQSWVLLHLLRPCAAFAFVPCLWALNSLNSWWVWCIGSPIIGESIYVYTVIVPLECWGIQEFPMFS